MSRISALTALPAFCVATLFLPIVATAASRPRPEPKMTFLDNGEVRIGMDLALGGAVTFISSRDHPANIINSADLGRQIQMSHYSGPWPFEVPGKTPSKYWAGLGWNPIQTGDCYMNPSRVLEHRNTGKELYIKCIPMQWPHDDVPGDCIFETWTTLDGPVIQMRFRCTNDRADKTFYRPCGQELPAVYTISNLSRLMSYTGDKPFTGDAVTHVTNDWRKPWPWTRFTATERWAALVDEKGWGIGVFKDDGGEFHGGIHGDARSDDPKHSSTAYVAPIHTENFDHNIVYEHQTTFVIGTLEEIRRRCNASATRTPPAWRFDRDRRHWTLRDAVDQGFPLKGEWRIRLGDKPARLNGPTRCWRAEEAPILEVEAAFTPADPVAASSPSTAPAPRRANLRLQWKRLGEENPDAGSGHRIALEADGLYHVYRVNLAEKPAYRGLLTGLALQPSLAPGAQLAIKSITLGKPAASRPDGLR